MLWGLLGPGELPAQRRTRGLGLGSAVRHFNELAVPGMGGLWFAKPVFLALLGIHLAERCGKSNIPTANAVEALGCWVAFYPNGHHEDIRDPRLAGRLKLRQYTELPAFSVISSPGAYVSQPMRQRTTAALTALGLVEKDSRRFNGMRLSADGVRLLETEADHFRPKNKALAPYLAQWVAGQKLSSTPTLTDALSPRAPLSAPARDILRDRILAHGPGAARRRAVADWLAEGAGVDWEARPACIAADHWRDLRAGAAFFALRNAVLELLDAIEVRIATPRGEFLPRTGLPAPIAAALAEVRTLAREFLAQARELPRPPELQPAFELARHLDTDNDSDALLGLAERDGRLLTVRGDRICAGPVFRGAQALPPDTDQTEPAGDPDEDAAPTMAGGESDLPQNISVRVHNLRLIMADLDGRLDGLLAENP